jgi:hypothetical protein
LLVHDRTRRSIFSAALFFTLFLPPWIANRERQAHFRHHIAARDSRHGSSVKELSIQRRSPVASYHITGRVELDIRQSDRPDDALPSALRRSERDKEHLVFDMINYFAKLPFQINHLGFIEVAFED